MDEKISLPEGGWALLRDPRRVTQRQRRPVERLRGRVMASQVGAILMEKDNREALGEDAASIDRWFTEATRQILGSDDYALLDDLTDALIDALVAEWSYAGEPSAEAAQDLPGDVFEVLKTECSKRAKDLVVGFNPGDVGDETSPTGPSVE